MYNFDIYTPTKVVFGKGTESRIGELVKAQNCKKVLIHYGGGSVVRSGLLDRVKKALEEENIAYVELGGAVPNPRLSKVYEGIEICKQEGVDFILAVGGGSAIDSAKGIAYGAAEPEYDVWDLYEHTRQANAALPVGVILTLAATGTEMSMGSVITKEEGWLKRAYDSDLGRPKFAVMNPELTMTLPDYQTACGCADIIMHTLERYFVTGGTMEITDGIAEALLRTVMKNAKILVSDPMNYEARAEVMWAGSISHNGMTGCGAISGGDWSTHMLEHELGGMYDVAHGAGLAALWGSWARYVWKDCPHRFVSLAKNVLGVEGADDEETIIRGIEAMEDFFRAIRMPTSFRELGIAPTEAEMAEMAKKCSAASGGAQGCAKVLKEADMLAIYKMANER